MRLEVRQAAEVTAEQALLQALGANALAAMKSFFKHLGQNNQKDPNSLIGKCIQCSQFNLLCEETIGAGGYASIYRVRDQPTNQVYALKHLRLPQDSDAVADVRQEMRVMHLLGSHPNVLKLHAASFAGPAGKETDAFMVMDYCPITLLDMMQRSNFQLDEFFVHEVFSEVCHAVAHMHTFSPAYAHRDIKAENVLKTSKGKWVLCDFGSSTTKAQVFETPAEIAMEEDVIRRTTTPAYRAPEMWDLMSRQRIDTKVDIWALGVLLYVLVFGKLPFQGDSKLSVLFGKYDMPAGKHPLMCDLIRDMLTTDPALRPDIMTVIGRLDMIKQSLLQSIIPPSSTGVVSSIPVGPLQQASGASRMPGTTAAPQPSAKSNGLQRISPVAPNVHHASSAAAAAAAHHGPASRHSSVTTPAPSQTSKTSPALWPSQAAGAPSAATAAAAPPALVASHGSHVTQSHGSHIIQSHPVSVHNTPGNNNSNAIPGKRAAAVAASTPLFVPSEGALQIAQPAPIVTHNSFSHLSSQQPQLPAPPQPPQPATTTLIDVEEEEQPGQAKASLLGDGFSPAKKHGGHRHHRSSSFSKDIALTLSAAAGHAAGGDQSGSSFSAGFGVNAVAANSTATFDPDWGDQPAFGSNAHQSGIVQSTTSGQPQGRVTPTPSGGLHKHHASQQQQQQGSHSVPIASRKSETGAGGGGGGGAAPSSPAVSRRSPFPSRAHSHGVEGSADASGQGQQGFGNNNNNNSNNSVSNAGMQTELDMLKVQVKGLLSTQASLLSRVKQLEDITTEQATVIRTLQQDVRGQASDN